MNYLLCLLAFVSGAALAHPGKTDDKGCHKKDGERHCHPASASAPAFRLSDPEPQEAPKDPTCLTGPRGAEYRIINGRKVVGCK